MTAPVVDVMDPVCPECGGGGPIGIEFPELYDGILVWQCAGCGHRWPRFGEQYGWGDAGHLFRVGLGDTRVLRIGTVGELDAFHARWSQDLVPGHPLIRWDQVAGEWDGIEVAPYLWDRRLGGPASSWYYTWDCASGCVWEPRGVRVEYLHPMAGAVSA